MSYYETRVNRKINTLKRLVKKVYNYKKHIINDRRGLNKVNSTILSLIRQLREIIDNLEKIEIW